MEWQHFIHFYLFPFIILPFILSRNFLFCKFIARDYMTRINGHFHKIFSTMEWIDTMTMRRNWTKKKRKAQLEFTCKKVMQHIYTRMKKLQQRITLSNDKQFMIVFDFFFHYHVATQIELIICIYRREKNWLWYCVHTCWRQQLTEKERNTDMFKSERNVNQQLNVTTIYGI